MFAEAFWFDRVGIKLANLYLYSPRLCITCRVFLTNTGQTGSVHMDKLELPHPYRGLIVVISLCCIMLFYNQ